MKGYKPHEDSMWTRRSRIGVIQGFPRRFRAFQSLVRKGRPHEVRNALIWISFPITVIRSHQTIG